MVLALNRSSYYSLSILYFIRTFICFFLVNQIQNLSSGRCRIIAVFTYRTTITYNFTNYLDILVLQTLAMKDDCLPK